jgi:hypothetical protein
MSSTLQFLVSELPLITFILQLIALTLQLRDRRRIS